MRRQRFRQLDRLGDLSRCVASVGQTNGLVVGVLVDIAVLGDEVGDSRISPDRPVVLAEIDLRVAELVERQLQIARPAQRVANLGAAHRQQVVHGLRQNFGAAISSFIGDREGQLCRRFGTGHVVKDKAHAVQHQVLRGLGDQLRRREDADGAISDVLAQAGVDQTIGRAIEVFAELVHSAPRHRGADQDVLAGGLLDETLGSDHRDLAQSEVLCRGHTQRATKVVDMAVREDDGRHRLVAQVPARESQRCGCGLARCQRVDHDEPSLALDQRHVGEVEAAQLVDAVGDLEQACLGVELGVAPQAGIDCVGRLALDELESVEVDQQAAVGAQQLAFRPGDKTAAGVVEVLRVVEFEVLHRLRVGADGGRHRVAGSGVCDATLAAAREQRERDQRQQQSANANRRHRKSTAPRLWRSHAGAPANRPSAAARR